MRNDQLPRPRHGLVVRTHNAGSCERDTLLLRLPAVGGLVHLAAIERFCRVLAALVHTGVPLPDAVHVAADSTNNQVFQGKLTTAREAMMRGEGLARPIAATGIFPPAARQMIRVGESTGSLDTQLHNAALFYERELSFRLKRFTDMFEPADSSRGRFDGRVRRDRTDFRDVQRLQPGKGLEENLQDAGNLRPARDNRSGQRPGGQSNEGRRGVDTPR